MKCDMNCFNCKFEECINDSDSTLEERIVSSDLDKDIHFHKMYHFNSDLVDVKNIQNRADKEDVRKLKSLEYDRKRYKTPKRKAQKRNQYLNHREEKLAYQKEYYLKHREEQIAYNKARYEANKEEINRKRREKRRKEKEDAKRRINEQTVCN